MTEERREHQRKNAERLTDITLWMFKNKDAWTDIYYGERLEEGTTAFQSSIMDELKMRGYMELYLILLSRIGDILGIGMGRPESFLLLLESSSRDIPLDMEKLRKEIL